MHSRHLTTTTSRHHPDQPHSTQYAEDVAFTFLLVAVASATLFLADGLNTTSKTSWEATMFTIASYTCILDITGRWYTTLQVGLP
jgi:hypothetical protein